MDMEIDGVEAVLQAAQVAAQQNNPLDDSDNDLFVGDINDDDDSDEYVDDGNMDVDTSDEEEYEKSQQEKRKHLEAWEKYRRNKKRAFFRAASSKKNRPEVAYNLSQGNEAYVNRQFDEAFQYFKEAVRLDPKSVLAYKSLGDIANKRGQKGRCCDYWYIAAVNSQWDGDLWSMVGELSTQLGLTSRAIQAYGKAISLRTKNRNQLIYERALLYKETSQFGRALDSFRKLSELFPTDASYLKELAEVYLEDRRINDAINLYMDLLHKNINQPDNAGKKFPKLGWQEINILIELYTTKRNWRLGLKVFKLAARYLHDRESETFWDDVDNDAEFDERRWSVLNSMPSAAANDALNKEFDVPIDLRFKLGQLRLELDQKEEALRHFEMLLNEDVTDISDLLLAAGRCLELHGNYEEALKFLERAHLEFDDIVVLGTCYLELGQYEDARKTFEAVVEADPDDINIKLSLAEALYHLGESEEAKILLDDVSSKRKQLAEALSSDGEEGEVIILANNTLQLSRLNVKKSKDKKLTDEQKQEVEEHSKRRVLDTFRRMQRLQEAIDKGESVAIDTWLQLAIRLIEIFTSVPNFFPRDKSRVFKGIVLYRRKKPMEVDERIARVYNLYDGVASTDLPARLFLTSEKEYRGLNYDDWFMVFVQYALLNAKFKDNLEYSIEIIDVAMDVNVFIQNKLKEGILKMVRLMFGIMAEDFHTVVMNYVRFFLMGNQFSPFIYKFFVCCFPSGLSAWEAFGNYNHQKFFLRQLKAFDSLHVNHKISGMATITADIKNSSLGDEHADLLYVYSNLLGGNRNFISPIAYLNRAYNRYSKDPMICLTLGLAHVHRAMQRLSSNRHIQLLQGFSYMIEYQELRLVDATDYEKQEVEFNMGKLYHLIGLTTEAVTRYEAALSYHDKLQEDPEYDMLMEAAYNLCLIYNINGNAMKALEIAQKYLTV